MGLAGSAGRALTQGEVSYYHKRFHEITSHRELCFSNSRVAEMLKWRPFPSRRWRVLLRCSMALKCLN